MRGWWLFRLLFPFAVVAAPFIPVKDQHDSYYRVALGKWVVVHGIMLYSEYGADV